MSPLRCDSGRHQRPVRVDVPDERSHCTAPRAAIERRGQRNLVVAGAAEGRDQKVHNLLAALDEVEPTDVWAFADSAGRPDREWFRRLVAMLTQPDVRVASTNRFYVTPIEWRGRVYEMRSSSEIVIVR